MMGASEWRMGMQDSVGGPHFEPHVRRMGSGEETPGTDRPDATYSGVLRRIGRGMALLVGVVWLLVSMLLAGLLVGLSSSGRDLTESQSKTGIGAAYVVLGCGVALIVLFAAAVVKPRYGVAFALTLVPFVAFSIGWTGEQIGADFFGAVPSIGTAVAAAIITLASTVAIGGALFLSLPGERSGATRDVGGATSPATSADGPWYRR